MTYTAKAMKFNAVLYSAKQALDSIGFNFHLHAGTALGAHREKSFIEHDHDIDIAVFYKDVNTPAKVKKLIKAMEDNGFYVDAKLGKISRGFEIQFEKDDIGLDIFWIYEGNYRGKDYYLVSSYYGDCDKLPHKTCVWGYSPYNVEKINFIGHTYDVVPQKTLVDMYGEDWNVVKKFSYDEGIKEGGYKGFLKDYYKPIPTDNKIAFCFLLYDTVKHNKEWVKFFSEDNNPVSSYNIYTHLKEVTDKTPEWIKKNAIPSIKTGWCEESLVWAWVKLLKESLKNPDNKYFVLLSGECIPLFTFFETYKKITKSTKSRINVTPDSEATYDTGLLYADQWVLLNRKHAQMLVNLQDTEAGKKWVEKTRKILCAGDYCYCSDELYPVNWFIHKYGKYTSQAFKKEFQLMPTTYTYWSGKQPHPIKFNSVQMNKMKKDICKSGAIFGRKFNAKAAKELSMTCGEFDK